MENEVFIVGSGPTVADIDLNKLLYKQTICVNCAILDVPSPNHFITKDYTFLTKLKFGIYGDKNNFPPGDYIKYFVVGLHDGTITTDGIYYYHKSQPGEHFKLNNIDQIIVSKKQTGLGRTWSDFRCGGDSGYTALQLAYLLGYKTIYLIGFDFAIRNKKTHCHKYYGSRSHILMDKKLNKWSRLYKAPLQQLKDDGISVISLSPISRLNNYISYEPEVNVL